MSTEIQLFDECDDLAYTLMGRATDAIEGKQFKQRPRVAWRYPLDEEGVQYIELRPEYITTEQDKHRSAASIGVDFDYTPIADSNFQYTGNISLDLGIEQDGELRRSGGTFTLTENYGGIALVYDKLSGKESRYKHLFSEEELAQEAESEVRRVDHDALMDKVAPGVATAVKMVIEQPEKLAEMAVSHCCYCGRGLIDAESLSRGYGPECAKSYNLPYVHTPSKWKDKRPEPTIIDNLGLPLQALGDPVLVPTEVKYYRYRKNGQEVHTKSEDRALLYQGSRISKHRRPVTIIRRGVMSNAIRFTQTNLVRLSIEEYAQYERALAVLTVDKKARNVGIQMVIPDFHDHNADPFFIIVDGWVRSVSSSKYTREECREKWESESTFITVPSPSAPADFEGNEIREEGRLHIEAFLKEWVPYVEKYGVKEIVRLTNQSDDQGAANTEVVLHNQPTIIR